MATTSCAYECSLASFGFRGCQAENFYFSQWGTNKAIFVAYRAVFFLYALAWIISDLVLVRESQYEIYLTNWSEVTDCVYFALALCVAVYGCTSHSKQQSSEIRWLHKLTWVVFNVAFSAALITDLLFWFLLTASYSQAGLLDPFNIQSHVINFVILLIDLLVSRIPIRLLHFIYPVTYSIVYILFTLILHWSKVTSSVYSLLNWAASPGLAAGYGLATALVGMPLAHVLAFAIFNFRAWLSRSVGLATQDTRLESEENVEMGQTNLVFE